MEAALQYVQELERSLPAGSRPLVMHSFRAAMEVGSEQLHMGSEDVAENGEFFRLILLAMRRYLELYAHLAGPHGKARPLAVTHTEFEAAKPLFLDPAMRAKAAVENWAGTFTGAADVALAATRWKRKGAKRSA